MAFAFVSCDDSNYESKPAIPEDAIKVTSEKELSEVLMQEDNAVIALDSDIKLSDESNAITINGNKTIYLNDKTLDLNGKVASPDDTKVAAAEKIRGGLFVDNNAKLTIYGDGKINSTAEILAINNDAEVVINGGEFTAGKGTATIRVRGKLTVNDGELNSEDHSSIYLVSGCDVTVNGGIIRSTSNSYVVNINGTLKDGLNFKVTGGNFYGTIYLAGKSTTTISGGTFDGGDEAVPLYIKSGEIDITGGEFIGPKKDSYGIDYIYYGNGIFLSNGDIIVDSCNYPGGAPNVKINNVKLNSGIYLYKNPEKADAYEGKIDAPNIEYTPNPNFTHKKELKFKWESSANSETVTLFFTSEEKANAFTKDKAKEFAESTGVLYENLGDIQTVTPANKNN